MWITSTKSALALKATPPKTFLHTLKLSCTLLSSLVLSKSSLEALQKAEACTGMNKIFAYIYFHVYLMIMSDGGSCLIHVRLFLKSLSDPCPSILEKLNANTYKGIEVLDL